MRGDLSATMPNWHRLGPEMVEDWLCGLTVDCLEDWLTV